MTEANSAVREVEDDGSEEVFGKEVGLLHKVMVTGRKVGADKGFWTKLADDVSFAGEAVRLSTGAFVLTRPTFPGVKVDYSLDPQEALRRAKVDFGIMKHRVNREVFPTVKEGVGYVDVALFMVVFRREGKILTNPSTGEVEWMIQGEGYRLAIQEEVAALIETRGTHVGEHYPRLVAPGSPISAMGTAIPLFSYDLYEEGVSEEGWRYDHYAYKDVNFHIRPAFYVGVKDSVR